MNNKINKAAEPDINGSSDSSTDSQISFVDHLTHELRMPVHGIFNIAHFLSEHWAEINDSQRLKHIKKISASCDYLKSLLDGLLDLSEIENPANYFNRKEEDLTYLVNDAIEQCHGLYVAKPELNVLNVTTINRVPIYADKFMINQLLTNLLSNAIKYTQRGTITLGVADFWYKGDSYWRCDIKDQGVGIPDDELEAIFEAFVRSTRVSNDKNFKGTGLGLAICRGIVNNHNGKIWATNNSDKEKGATFSFIIPKYAPAQD